MLKDANIKDSRSKNTSIESCWSNFLFYLLCIQFASRGIRMVSNEQEIAQRKSFLKKKNEKLATLVHTLSLSSRQVYCKVEGGTGNAVSW